MGGDTSASYGSTSGGMQVFGPDYGQLNQPSPIYGAVGKGLQTFGASLGNNQYPQFNATIPQLSSMSAPQSTPAELIPVPQQQGTDLLAALQRLLSGIA